MNNREILLQYAQKQAPVYQQLALDIHAHPEVSNYEFYACEHLSGQLAAEGFDVKVDVAGHRTGFTACYKAQKAGPVLVFLAEYDALQGLGHGCGHNLFGTMSALAAASLKQVVDAVGGEIRVYGTPGEEGGENGSAKGSFVREGFLKDVDAALCVHPIGGKSLVTAPSLGCAPVDIEFWGKSAHAAANPEAGINALDALILTYNGINALRQHVTPDIRIHGIIVNGGSAPNSVPDYAKGKFYLRAATAPRLERLYQRVDAIVQGAAQMTGARGRMQPYQNRVENTVLTPSFDALYRKNYESLGFTMGEASEKGGIGSSDVGNISQVVPTIQPSISISDERIPGHSEAFKAASCSQKGLDAVVIGAQAMALTALDLIEHPELLAAIREEHRRNVAAQEA